MRRSTTGNCSAALDASAPGTRRVAWRRNYRVCRCLAVPAGDLAAADRARARGRRAGGGDAAVRKYFPCAESVRAPRGDRPHGGRVFPPAQFPSARLRDLRRKPARTAPPGRVSARGRAGWGGASCADARVANGTLASCWPEARRALDFMGRERAVAAQCSTRPAMGYAHRSVRNGAAGRSPLTTLQPMPSGKLSHA